MSASNIKRSVWSRILGIIAAPAIAEEPVAAHLRSMSPEDSARLLGAGSRPPRSIAITAPSSQHVTQDEPVAGALPWPLLRTTGAFQAEHAKFDRALALSTVELLAQLCAEADELLLDEAALTYQTARPATAARNLAGQLAVVARLNQPKARAASAQKAHGPAAKRYAKSALAKNAARSGQPVLERPAAGTKAGHDMHSRPQAIVIDLAAIKKVRRAEKFKRAA